MCASVARTVTRYERHARASGGAGAGSGQVGCGRRPGVEGGAGRGVRRQERLEGELGERDVVRRAERRHRRVERQVTGVGGQVQRQQHVARRGRQGGRVRGRVGTALGEQRGEPRVRGHPDLPFEAVQQVLAPLGQVADPRREPARVQADSVDVHRRSEHLRVEPRPAAVRRRRRPAARRPTGPRRAPGTGRARRRAVPARPGPVRARRRPGGAPCRRGRSRRRATVRCARAAGCPAPRPGHRAARGWRRPGRSRRSSGAGWTRRRRGRGPSG